MLFPGGHVGYAKWSDEFGPLLRTVLAGSAPARVAEVAAAHGAVAEGVG
ncbi:hypothetical protein [Streptomyces sp. IB2014 016-6]|nr:hypothetical protein [Streptomyces sp. IB2014 016-6]